MSSFKRSPIGSILERIVTGSTPSTLHPEYFDGTTPWFTPGDIGISRNLLDSSRHISELALKKGKAKHFEKGMLLITCIGEIGRVGVLQESASSNQQITALRFYSEIDTYYAYYWFIAHQYVLQHFASQAVVPILNNARLKDIDFTYPPLPEQNRIATILEKADRLRRLRRYARKMSDTYLQSVFLEMFGEYLDNNAKSVFSDVLIMPLQNGVFEKNENYGSGIPVIWVDNLYHTISIETENLREVKLDENTVKKYGVLQDDLLFTRSSLVREGVGQINIVPKIANRITFECHIIRARVDRNIVEPHYILGLYRSSFGKNAILKRSNTATMTTISQESLQELPCPIPSLQLQKEFTQIVQKFECLQFQQREAERQAEHLFHTLLHRAFKGELG